MSSMSTLLKEFIKLSLSEGEIARVPNQLLSPESVPSGEEEKEEAVQEFSSVGGGNIVGYSLPLGMDPDAAGRQKNRPRRKKKNK